MDSSAIFSQQFDIQSHTIDVNKDVNLQYLLGCMQTTADLHVDSRGIGWKELNEKGGFWAIYRMGLQIERLPRKYDHITIRTWANPPQNLLQPRSFEVVGDDGTRFLRAQSLWIVMSTADFHPLKVEEVVGSDVPYLIGADSSFEMNLKVPRIALPEETSSLLPQRVKYSDIDVNHHVNNTTYVRWFIDSYDFDFLQHHHLKELIINYTKQIKADDEYAIFLQKKSESEHLFSIVNASDGSEYCKMKAEWSR